MAIKSHITDSATKITAEVIHKEDCDCNALAVATVPYREFENELKFFIDEEGSADMNINAAPSGTPLPVHDGTDTTLWTGTTISGASTVDFDKAEHPRTGTKSIKVEEETDVVWQFDNGSSLNMALYNSLTIWIYVDKEWKAGDSVSIYGWDTSTGLKIGNTLYLEDYFDYLTHKVYQKISIPLTDFGDLSASTTLDAFRQRIVAKDGGRAKFYMDDIQLEGVGTTTPTKYTIQADKGTWLFVDSFTISIVAPKAIASAILADSTMPKLSYNNMLGVTLLSGLNYRRVTNGETIFSVNVKTLMDFMQQPNTKIVSMGDDDVNTFVTLEVRNAEPLLLKATDEDELSFTVTDDLSGLTHLRVAAGCRVEKRELQ